MPQKAPPQQERDSNVQRPRQASTTKPGVTADLPGSAADKTRRVLALQRTVGNRSVARMIARQAGNTPNVQRHEQYLSHFEIDLGEDMLPNTINTNLAPQSSG